MRLKLYGFGKPGKPFGHHYSQVNSSPEWWALTGLQFWINWSIWIGWLSSSTMQGNQGYVWGTERQVWNISPFQQLNRDPTYWPHFSLGLSDGCEVGYRDRPMHRHADTYRTIWRRCRCIIWVKFRRYVWASKPLRYCSVRSVRKAKLLLRLWLINANALSCFSRRAVLPLHQGFSTWGTFAYLKGYIEDSNTKKNMFIFISKYSKIYKLY